MGKCDLCGKDKPFTCLKKINGKLKCVCEDCQSIQEREEGKKELRGALENILLMGVAL
jgi:hypothetical protein